MGIPLAVVLAATLAPVRGDAAVLEPQETAASPTRPRHRRALSPSLLLHRPVRASPLSTTTTSGSRTGLRALVRPVRANLPAALAFLVLLLAFPIALRAMLDPGIGQEDWLNAVVNPRTHPPSRDPGLTAFEPSEALARRLDSLSLPRGSVLIDASLGYSALVRSDHPDQFVIDSDYDFLRDLDDPARYGIRYIIDYAPVSGFSLGQTYAMNRRYPSMWSNGAGISTLAFSEGQGSNEVRVYRVNN
jgi:hypothetical protein